jgi:hypothetical protein
LIRHCPLAAKSDATLGCLESSQIMARRKPLDRQEEWLAAWNESDIFPMPPFATFNV